MINTFDIGIQLLHSDAKLPTKANLTDSCYDVVAVKREALSTLMNEQGETLIYGYKYHLGFALDLPPDTELQVRARSSIFKTGLVLCNGIGTGDEGYTGEYSVIFYHVVSELPPYEVGDRVAQIQCISRADINFNLVDKLPDKDRGASGFGSSGLKELKHKNRYKSTRDVTY